MHQRLFSATSRRVYLAIDLICGGMLLVILVDRHYGYLTEAALAALVVSSALAMSWLHIRSNAEKVRALRRRTQQAHEQAWQDLEGYVASLSQSSSD